MLALSWKKSDEKIACNFKGHVQSLVKKRNGSNFDLIDYSQKSVMAINQYFVFIIDSTERPVPGTIQMLNFSPWYRITFLKSVSQNFHLLTFSFLSTFNRFLTLCFTFAFEKWFDRYYCVIWGCKVATFPLTQRTWEMFFDTLENGYQRCEWKVL